MAKAKQVVTLEDLEKDYQATRKELQAKTYVQLMAALKVLNPGKTDSQIVAIYEEQATAAKEAAKAAKAAKKAAKAEA